MIKFSLLAILPSLALLCSCTAVPPDLGLIDGRLRPCPDSPNCVNSETGSAKAAIPPLHFETNGDQAWTSLKQIVIETGGRIVTDEPGYLRAVYTSTLFRFADDVEFRLDRGTSTIQLRSASRVGHWDLGVNRRRMEKIRRLFDESIRARK